MGRKLISESDGRECSAVEVATLAGYKNNDPAMVYQHVARGTPIAGHQWRWSDEPANGHDVLTSDDPWGARILRTCSDDREFTPFAFDPFGHPWQDWQPVNPDGPGILGRELGLPRRYYVGGI
jgi:hypothetical protein